jgi:hypothetical protein
MTSSNPHEKEIQGILGSEGQKTRDELIQQSNEMPLTSNTDEKTIVAGIASAVDLDAATPHDIEQEAMDPNAEPPSERPIERVVSGEDYSVLTVSQKKMVILTVSLASLFSPMATAIYCMMPSKMGIGSANHS